MGRVTCLLLLSALCWAQEFDQEMNRYRERVLVVAERGQDLRGVSQLGIDIDRCSGIFADRFYAYATPQESDRLRSAGFAVTAAPISIGEDSREVAYHTYETLTEELKQLTSQYPEIARLDTLGKSVQGRELWVVKISDNVGGDEAEPEVKYVSTMHGDEVVGQELMIYLIRHLLENYRKDANVTRLVDDLETWIVPNMNPDGTALKRRYNANWVDLNRNFPDPQADPVSNDPTGKAIETQHMMRFTAQRHCAISLNFHGGAVVVNYPWDTMAGDVPDITFTKFVSLGYSKLNPPMYKSTSFKDGITNGYAWYEVNGGMQDWNYHWHNTLDLTVEVSQSKWPAASTLPQYWQDNRASLLWFLAQACRGVHGRVTDAATGQPVCAKVEVEGIAKPIYSTTLHGDYQRVLPAGRYNIKFSAAGYQPAIFRDIDVSDSETPAMLDVSLQK